jgi:hypothetical protein
MAKRAFTQKQREAVRANGRKSKGPVTEQGKARSSRNATRHGILANTIVLDSESRQRFFDLIAGLQQHFKPATVVESALIENMAVCQWRQARVLAMEKVAFTLETGRLREQDPQAALEDPAILAFLSFRGQSKFLEALSRYETRFDRQYSRTLMRLIRIRQNKEIPLVS